MFKLSRTTLGLFIYEITLAALKSTLGIIYEGNEWNIEFIIHNTIETCSRRAIQY